MSAGRLLRAGQRLAARGCWAEALAALREACRAAPRDGMARLHLGLAALDAGDAETARQALAEARRLLPRHSFVLCAQGAAAYDRGEWKAARAAWSEAGALDRGYGLPQWLTGLVDWAAGDLAAARLHLVAAPPVHIRLLDGRLLARVEHALFDRGAELSPAPAARASAPSLSPLRHRWAAALAEACGILHHPLNARARSLYRLRLRGMIALDQRRYAEAVEALAAARAAAAGDGELALALAEALLELDQPRQAQEALEGCEWDDAAMRQQAAMLRAVAAYMLQRYEEAARLLEPWEVLPPIPAYWRGLAYLRLGRWPQAGRDLGRWAAAAPPRWLRERLELALGA